MTKRVLVDLEVPDAWDEKEIRFAVLAGLRGHIVTEWRKKAGNGRQGWPHQSILDEGQVVFIQEHG